jgi:hypothetical protein
MYIARLICSDEGCGEQALAEARTVAELETLACDCGCALAVIGWPDHTDEPGADMAVDTLGRLTRSPFWPRARSVYGALMCASGQSTGRAGPSGARR